MLGEGMNIHPTSIADLVVAESKTFKDERGAFARLFCEQELSPILGGRTIVQINHSCTEALGVVRGMHFQQPPHAEMKLVRCLKGKVWDVAVDLRPNSSSYKLWFAQELSPDNAYMMVIPEGFAHGFQVLEAGSELLYLHTAFYSPEFESGVSYDDPELGIAWPMPVTHISHRDSNHAYLDSSFTGIVL
jgi:dTDP-4-dehydrorhamnose 3,5-epimerase